MATETKINQNQMPSGYPYRGSTLRSRLSGDSLEGGHGDPPMMPPPTPAPKRCPPDRVHHNMLRTASEHLFAAVQRLQNSEISLRGGSPHLLIGHHLAARRIPDVLARVLFRGGEMTQQTTIERLRESSPAIPFPPALSSIHETQTRLR